MAASLLLGIDIGTYSSKGVVCQPDGTILATATVEHDLLLPQAGWAEHDPDAVWWGDFVGLCRILVGQGIAAKDIAAVAVSAIGPCVLPVDSRGKPLRNGILYGIDTRANQEIEELTRQFGEDALLERNGMILTSQSVGPKILWLRRNEPHVFDRSWKLLPASSYIVFRLTGRCVTDRHTASYYNPLFNSSTQDWDDMFAELICDRALLPELLWSDEVAGVVTPTAASDTGLLAGTPVTAGTIDAAAEALSVGVASPGEIMVMYGTTMFFILVAGATIPDRRMWATTFLFDGTFGVEGGMSTTGALTRWFRDHLGKDLLERERSGGENAYSALATEASRIPPGSGGLLCLPYFSGERTPINDADARGVFAGLTLTHTRGHLYRAALEGTAFGVRHNLEVMSGMGATPSRLVAVGGGAKNPLWMQIVSDVTGVPQDVPRQTIGASYGDAYLAGRAIGLFPSLDSLIDEWVGIGSSIEPERGNADLYSQYYDVYRSLHGNTVEVQHRLAELERINQRSQ